MIKIFPSMGQRNSRRRQNSRPRVWNININFFGNPIIINNNRANGNQHQQHHQRYEQPTDIPLYVEEGVFAVMDSAGDFDDSPPKYQDFGIEKTENSHINENSDDSYSSDPDWDNSSDESTEWTEHFSDWAIKLVHMDELLQEKLFEEWLQEKCYH